MDKDYNDLHGDNLIHLFEMKWRKWDAKDCLKWFEYILTCKTIQSNNKNNKNEYDDVRIRVGIRRLHFQLRL